MASTLRRFVQEKASDAMDFLCATNLYPLGLLVALLVVSFIGVKLLVGIWGS